MNGKIKELAKYFIEKTADSTNKRVCTFIFYQPNSVKKPTEDHFKTRQGE